jgi:hypothetical protein
MVFIGTADQFRPRPQKAPEAMLASESLVITKGSASCQHSIQDTAGFHNGSWADNRHLFFFHCKLGDQVTFKVPVPQAGKYQLILYFTKSYDYGKLKVNFEKGSANIDLFHDYITNTNLNLGHHVIKGREGLLTLKVVGTNPKSRPPHYQFGFDGLRLVPR